LVYILLQLLTLLNKPQTRSTLFPYTTLFRSIKDIAEEKGIPFNEGTFTVDFLRNADEIIVSSTSIEVMPVVKLDGGQVGDGEVGDRKSTRLNSSHVSISYAVFCLKKKN